MSDLTLRRLGRGASSLQRLQSGHLPVRETPQPYGDTPPGGYRKRAPEDYDPTLCLLPRDGVDFGLATQPKEWKKLEQHHREGG